MSRFFPITYERAPTHSTSYDNPQTGVYNNFYGPPPNLTRVPLDRERRTARRDYTVDAGDTYDRQDPFSDAMVVSSQNLLYPELPPTVGPEYSIRLGLPSAPRATARRLTLSKSAVGYYPTTIPRLICHNFKRGVLVRRFEILQCVDRSQFEGGRKRGLGELSHWSGHGPSKLRISITVQRLGDKDYNDSSDEPMAYLYGDDMYDYDSEGTVVINTWRSLSSELKECGEWEDYDAYAPQPMEVDSDARLF